MGDTFNWDHATDAQWQRLEQTARVRDQILGRYHRYRIGVVVHNFSALGPTYRRGDAVLYRPWPNWTLTVEYAMTNEQIAEQQSKRSLLRTIHTIVGVPRGYVEKVRPAYIAAALSVAGEAVPHA